MILIAICASVGVATALIVWQLGSVFSAIPTENREWRDRPAIAFRIVWPFISFFEHYVSEHYSPSRHQLTKKILVQAGLEYTISIPLIVTFSA